MCPACEGQSSGTAVSGQRSACQACGGTGAIRLTACPLESVTPETWEAIDLAGMLKKGLPPVAGGVLDQAKVFLDAARFVWNEEAKWKARLEVRG